jgi:hypothetical protein
MNSNLTRWTRLKLAAQSLRRFLSPSTEVWSVATWLMLAVWVDRGCPLLYQQVSHRVKRKDLLLVCELHRNRSHSGPAGGLANRLGVIAGASNQAYKQCFALRGQHRNSSFANCRHSLAWRAVPAKSCH